MTLPIYSHLFLQHILSTGRRLAELELYILLAKALPKYQLSTSLKEIKLKQSTVLQPAVPVPVNFRTSCK